MNTFLLDYYTRLRLWYDLRQKLETTEDLKQVCIEVDKFWQQCPMSGHYLHPDDIHKWPNPWELIEENTYCTYARGLGMIYTLYLLGIQDIDFVEAKDDNNEDVVLVLVSDAKYVLNYWPNTVLNNNLQDFRIVRHIDVSGLLNSINK